MLLGYVTVFLLALCVLPFLDKPRRYASSGVAIAVHAALSIAVFAAFGAGTYVATILAPFTIACAIGSYLFYAQHNAPGIELRAPGEGAHDDAALHGTTHLVTGPLMSWFTGNIGLHHVHHLNARIPFYRLAEAMAALPELHQPVVTSLGPRDIRACLRVALWDPGAGRMVGPGEVAPRTADDSRQPVPGCQRLAVVQQAGGPSAGSSMQSRLRATSCS
jgi:omega-6 fatty acid desaturase (delta-12 desaturase)